MKLLPILCFACLLIFQSCNKNKFTEPALNETNGSNSGNNLSTAQTYNVGNMTALNTAISSANPGDIIIMTNGNWGSVQINFSTNGTAGNPITLKAQTAGSVLLGDNSQVNFAGSYLIVSGLKIKNQSQTDDNKPAFLFQSNSSNCQLTNTAIVNYNYTGADQNANIKWVQLQGNHNKVDHCYFSGKTSLGPLFNVAIATTSASADHHVIEYNYFGDIQQGAKNNGYEAIRLGSGAELPPYFKKATFDTIRHNYFTECNGENEIISSKCSNNYFFHNTFHNSAGVLCLRLANDCRVEQNFFLGNDINKTGGLKIHGTGHVIVNNEFFELGGDNTYSAICLMNGSSTDSTFPSVNNILIDSNTFYHCKEFVENGFAFDTNSVNIKPKNVTFVANIFHNSPNPIIDVIRPADNFICSSSFYYNVSLPPGYSSIPGLTNANAMMVSQNGVPRISSSSPQGVKNLDTSNDLIYSATSTINAITANQVGVTFTP